MKKFLPFLASLLLASVSWGQTGNGVVLLTDASYTFTPTTVDSSATFNLSLKNDVGIAQTVFFGGLDAPFVLSNDAPVEVASQDTIDFSITFTPSAIGSFSDTLEVIGNVFGSASLVVSGDGIQVQLEWTPDTLAFDTTAIGQTNSQILALSSVGDGAAVISSIVFSDDIFSVDSALSSFNISEGATDTIVVNYAPVNAGSVDATMTLHTNDPTNATIEIALTAVGISEVSGEICDITWTLINSPYTLVGDVVVPEGCTLNIDPGVEVIGNDYDIEVFGAFFANGEEGNEVHIEVGELLSHTPAENMVLTHSSITETNEFEFPDFDFGQFRIAIESLWGIDSLASALDFFSDYRLVNDYPSSNLGYYVEDFSPAVASWSPSGTYNSFGGDGELNLDGFYQSNSNNYYDMYLLSPIISMHEGEIPTNISFRGRFEYWSDTRYFYPQVSINGGGYQDITTVTNPSNNYDNYSFSLNYNNVNTIRFRFRYRYRYGGRMRIDDVQFNTNYQTDQGQIIDSELSSIGTGNLTMVESEFVGDFHSVGDSLDVVLNNSTILTNTNRAKDSHGLGLYANHVNLITQNSSIAGHSLDGIHIESLTTDWTDENSLVSGNGEDGINVNGDIVWNSSDSEVLSNGADGILVSGDLDLDATELDVNGNGTDGIDVGANSNLTLYGARIQDNGARAIGAQTGSVIDLDYVLMDDNGGRGIDLAASGALSLGNCRLRGNGAEGIHSGSPVSVNHCDIAFSGGTGLVLTGNNFHTLNNSILWGNNSSNYTQIDIGGGVISTSYSTVQGRSSYGTSGSGQYYWGEGVIEADPLFADDDLHLEIFSPCVDGGQPWHQDAYMPFGLGGVRADMGMYGGPNNAYWGGEALPDGASSVTSVSDSPQDQGNVVGLTFGASF